MLNFSRLATLFYFILSFQSKLQLEITSLKIVEKLEQSIIRKTDNEVQKEKNKFNEKGKIMFG